MNYDYLCKKNMLFIIIILITFFMSIFSMHDNYKNKVDSEKSNKKDSIVENFENEMVEDNAITNDEVIMENKDEDIEQKENLNNENDNNTFNRELEHIDNLLTDNRYDQALYECNDLLEQVTDLDILLKLYDNIAIIYAIKKNYNDAIIYLQKSMKIKDTLSKEFMYARLLYKTGQIEKAKNIVLKIFEKDFVLDR